MAMDSPREGVEGRMRLPLVELNRPLERGELWDEVWGRDGRVVLRFHSARSADSSKLTCTRSIWLQDKTGHCERSDESMSTCRWTLDEYKQARHEQTQQLQQTRVGPNTDVQQAPDADD